ncbi:ECF transporter S component [Caloramator mitchellensis]|nr:ECF transporter S component [Caloramator mitchellensis]
MFRKIPILLIFMFIIITVLLTNYRVGIDKLITFSAVFIIIFFLLLFELKQTNVRKMAIISTLATLGGMLRIPFAIIPGLQPTTFIISVSGYTLGPTEGFIVGSIAAFISNFFLGHGPWTLWQMLGWGLCGLFFGWMKKIKLNRYFFALFCGLWGYIYGIILDMWYVVGFIKPISFYAIILGIIGSFPFDTMHAAGNVLLSLTFADKFINIINRFTTRFEVEYLD